MAPILFLLALVDLLALLAAAATGFAVSWVPGWTGAHFLLALGATVITLLAHCLTLLYLLGTGKSLQEAVDAHHLDPEILVWTRTAKRRAFPLLVAAAALTVATAIAGGATDSGKVPAWVHGLLGAGTLVLNVAAFYRELLVVGKNSELIESVKKTIVVEDIFDVLDHAPTAEDELPERYATGRNLFFLGLNVWLPYIYMVFVMRMRGVPAIPFAALCAAGMVSGLVLMWRHRPQA